MSESARISENIENKLRGALTVAELREMLEDLPGDFVPVFVVNYGDYCRTQQALPIRHIDEGSGSFFLSETAYSNSGLCLTENEETEEEDGDDFDPNDLHPCRTNIVVLR